MIIIVQNELRLQVDLLEVVKWLMKIFFSSIKKYYNYG